MAIQEKKDKLGPEVPMVRVGKAHVITYGGRDWADVTAAANAGTDGLGAERVRLGVITQQSNSPAWKPPLQTDGTPFPYLPLECAWLREVQGRAFLYLQNW